MGNDSTDAHDGRLTPEMIARSLVSSGDTTRLRRAMARARRGETVVIGGIGGSITQGDGASAEEHRWLNLVADWWRRSFPQAEIRLVNAGVGATGSNIGAHRASKHLLGSRPDFVVVEFAVNDDDNDLAIETLEGVVRQILNQPNEPAVALLFMANPDGSSTQERHSLIGRHYALPMVSFGDAFYPEFQSGRIPWQDVLPDTSHPNDWGHGCVAALVTTLLDAVPAGLPLDDAIPPAPPIPAPLTTDTFEFAAMYNAGSIAPVSPNGWNPSQAWVFGECWETDRPGQTIEFNVVGDAVSVTYYQVKGDMGMAEAQVDDLPPVRLNGWFEGEWGGYPAWALIARDLAPGTHRLRLRVLEERSPESNGHRFQLQAIMVAGLSHPA